MNATTSRAQPPDPVDPFKIFSTESPKKTLQQHPADVYLEQNQMAAFKKLREQVGAGENTDPAAAAARYQQFLTETRDLRPMAGIVISQVIAPLLQKGNGGAKAALEFLDTAIVKYEAHPFVLNLISTKAKILLSEKRPAEVVALFESHWGKLNEAGPVVAASTLGDYVAALEAEGKSEETILKLEQMLKGVPVFLNDGTRDASGWMYQKLVGKLLEANRADEAASWAKLHFMECAFDAAVLDRAAKMVAQALMVQDPSRKLFGAFVAAQKDPSQPNPLSAVALPQVEKEGS